MSLLQFISFAAYAVFLLACACFWVYWTVYAFFRLCRFVCRAVCDLVTRRDKELDKLHAAIIKACDYAEGDYE